MVNMDILTAILIYDCGVFDGLAHCPAVFAVIFRGTNNIFFHVVLIDISGIYCRGTIIEVADF